MYLMLPIHVITDPKRHMGKVQDIENGFWLLVPFLLRRRWVGFFLFLPLLVVNSKPFGDGFTGENFRKAFLFIITPITDNLMFNTGVDSYILVINEAIGCGTNNKEPGGT